jgi:hypothetical protein
MEITELIKHPEQLDRDTLYELRSMLALYPYFQTARLLMLQNLYLLHDPSFDEELRRAAIYITDRKMLFQMIEAGHYRLLPSKKNGTSAESNKDKGSRTISLIDNFLETMPQDNETKTEKRKPTPADAAVDYVAYLLESESEEEREHNDTPQLIGQSLIDNFLENGRGKITLDHEPELKPETEEPAVHTEETTDGTNNAEEGYFTETLARIYIKQGRYSKALEIIRQLSLQYPKKNVYFADQIRFLEKLIINNNKKIN